MITRSDKDLTEENNQHLDSLFSSLIHLLVIMAWFSFNTHTLFRLTTRVCVLKENQRIMINLWSKVDELNMLTRAHVIKIQPLHPEGLENIQCCLLGADPHF